MTRLFHPLAFAFRQVGYLPADIASAYREDPALRAKWLAVFELVLYPGLWAIAIHRFSHLLFACRLPFLPRLLSQIARFLTGIEIHPGARIGKGFFIDHGMGVVIGETAEIGEYVLMYHEVTLGGTSLKPGKRHPTIGNHVLIGAGAKIFGPLVVGDHSQIGGGAVVTKSVPSHAIVVGNPAQVVKLRGIKVVDPTHTVDQVSLPDPLAERVQALEERLERLSDTRHHKG